MPRYLRTGFATLDTLLGGEGLRRGSTVLLRGEPGTGKTTLALQVAKNAIDHEGHDFVYVSVEEPPRRALNEICRSFWEKRFDAYLGDPARWQVKDLTCFWERRQARQAFQDFADVIIERVFVPGGSPVAERDLWRRIREEWRDRPPEQVEREIRDALKDRELDTSLRAFWKQIPLDGGRPVLVVIDSLNALIHSAQVHFRQYSERQMLLAALRSFKGWRQRRRDMTVLLTVEEVTPSRSPAAESYIADTVVHLWRETITQPTPISPGRDVDWKHDLLFCQVLKGRGLAIQRRASCYEFVRELPPVPDNGIKFFPTFAAQGFVSLFYENLPQLDVIHHLRTVDVPSSYPGVVVQEFTRSALQRMFAVRRHTDRIPLRQPVMLANVDQYWVAELKKNQLLHALPAESLKLYALPLVEDGGAPPGGPGAGPAAATPPRGTSVIRELLPQRRFYTDGDGNYLAVPQMANVGMLVYRKDLLEAADVAAPPETWEEVEAVCRKLRRRGKDHRILLETQTYDTLMITALELGWSHGAFWSTVPRDEQGTQLEVRFEPGSRFDYFVEAITRLHGLIHGLRLVPENCSVDPENHRRADWAFARHWYSTWVDVLTRTDDRQRRVVRLKRRHRFGVARIPVSRAYRERAGGAARHHSAWGEWYLAVQKGSENVELGIDLINNLMTSRKISERALSGAALPVVERFYEAHGDDMCYGTDLTFNELREQFFKDAKSRLDFASYYRVARVLSGPLRAVVTNPRLGRRGYGVTVRDLLLKAFRELDPQFDPGG